MTFAPHACRRRAIAAPIRRADPVTSATLPCNVRSMMQANSRVNSQRNSPRMHPSDLPRPDASALAASRALLDRVAADLAAHGDWMSFARYMDLALYEP